MTIPNLPWWNSQAQAEFNTSGWMSDTAEAAGITGGFWNSDLVGKSNYIPPLSLKATISVPVQGGGGPSETPGYFNGSWYISAAAPVSSKWVSNQSGYPYTSSHDLGLRGSNVTDAQLSAWNLSPRQYIKLGVDGKPYIGPCMISLTARFDYNVKLGYYVGTASNPFANFVVVDSFCDNPGGRNNYNKLWSIPTPGANEIITPAWWTDRGGDTMDFILITGNMGYLRISFTSGTVGNYGTPTFQNITLTSNALVLNGIATTFSDLITSSSAVTVTASVDVGGSFTLYDVDGAAYTFIKGSGLTYSCAQLTGYSLLGSFGFMGFSPDTVDLINNPV